MSRPEVILPNAPEIFSWYTDHSQNQPFARFAHVALGIGIRAQITYGKGVQEAITEELDAGSTLVYSPPHPTDFDQYAIVSAVQRLRTLHRLRGNTSIPSKPDIFDQRDILHLLRRYAADEMGAVPAFRDDDLTRAGVEKTPEVIRQQKEAVALASSAHLTKIMAGENLAVFWEGTRNKVDFREIQPLKKGPAHTLLRAVELGKRVMFLPVGVFYGDGPLENKNQKLPYLWKPFVHFSMPYALEPSSPAEVVAKLHPALQQSVDIAAYRHDKATGIK
jgi:hypothetical protein